ncbi:hypothetical protein [Streptomyces sp. NPDC008150]|uniref:hypothetical protein n=1 Tax=Streptomyces sp. NPDC008150 TaxID=3364816 RepID=UPI0036EA529D
MDLDTLRFANFSLLDDAVEDWSRIVTHLKTLSDDAEKGLHQAANKANWAGENQKVTKEFIGKTAGEFTDAHTQASSVHGILSDTAGELKSYRTQLNDAIERGLKKNLTVLDTGNGTFTVTMNVHPDRAAAGHTPPEHDESDVTALRDEVQGILKKATTSDTSAKTVLTALADRSKYGFSDASYANRDEAADALKEADELAALAKKRPEDLTPADFDKINAGLKKYANDPLFAERFATVLGPEGVLEFWSGINDPHAAARLGQARLDDYDDLQRNLGLTLADATQSDSAAMTSWKGRMIALGDRRIGGETGPMGFQVMSNLMRTGDYDDQFLKSYGTALMTTERKLTGNGEHANLAWQHMGMDTYLNRIGDDSGDDPLTGYLKGLSNSPDAATDFMNEPFVTKDDSPFEEDTDGNGKKGRIPLSNFQYLFEKREWPAETNIHGDALHTGQNNLALALEAATTGHPAGEIPTLDTPAHNAGQTRLMESLVSSISDDPERLTKNSYMSDSIGQIASEYLPDINRATTNVSPNPNSYSWQQIEHLFPVSGSSAQLGHMDVTRFLVAVGQNPEAYAAVDVGQKKYMTNLMDYHLNPDLPDDLRYHGSMESTVTEIAHRSGVVSGELAIGRQEAVLGPAKEKDGDYDHAVSQWQNVINGAVGTGIGVGTSFIASPAVGAVAGGAAGTVSSVVMGELFQDVEGDNLSGAGQDAGSIWDTSARKGQELAQTAATEAARAHHAPYLDDVSEWARQGYSAGSSEADTSVNRMADDLTTEIS